MGVPQTILITGATGAQGSAVVHALKSSSYKVRALVRDLGHAKARALLELGVTLIKGDFEEQASLNAALSGVDAVFSVQLAPTGEDVDQERRQARALIDAARRANVRYFIHSSVSNAGDFQTMAGWSEGRWARNYWTSKADVEADIVSAGFPHYTILRPAFMMENFINPKVQYMFPDLANGRIETAVAADTKIAVVAAADIGVVTAASIANPDKFSGKAIELAGDVLTLPQIAAEISSVVGKAVSARTLPPAALCASGQSPGWVEMQEWMNVVGYPARPSNMEEYGFSPSSFHNWLRKNAAFLTL